MMTKRTREMRELPRARIQIYGDSVTDGALNDKVLAAACGLTLAELRNVSLPSSSAYFAATLLERQIDAGTAPEILVLGYNARSYSVPMVPKIIAHVTSWPETARLLWKDRPAFDSVLRGLLDRASFACRYRSELNSIVRYQAGYEVFQPTVTPATGLLERQEQLPASELDLPAEGKPSQPVELASGFSNGPFILHPEMERSLARLFDLAERAGIKILVVSMPKPPAAQALHESNGFNVAYAALLKQMAQRPCVRFLHAEQDTLPANDFLDAVHLTRLSGIRFSEKMGKKLQAILTSASPRR